MSSIELDIQKVARVQEIIVRLILCPEYRCRAQENPEISLADLGDRKTAHQILKRISFDQIERFNDIIVGTRLTSMLQKFTPISEIIGAEKLACLIRNFLHKRIIKDGRGDMDVRIFHEYCRSQFPGSSLANLISLQAARYIASYGAKDYRNLRLKLSHRVSAVCLNVEVDDLSNMKTVNADETHKGCFCYVVMPDSDEIAIHEIDRESYDILETIRSLGDVGEDSNLEIFYQKNYDILNAAASEGIVEIVV